MTTEPVAMHSLRYQMSQVRRLGLRAMRVDATELVGQCRDLVADDIHQTERLLLESVRTSVPELAQVIGYPVRTGGKRVRAVLVLLIARATDFPTHDAIRLACAAELVHAASLCHDDVIDQEATRRGRPPLRSLYSDSASILVGDLLLARAFRLLAEGDMTPAAVTLGETIEEMAVGELLQLRGAGAEVAFTPEYVQVIQKKTGRLFAWCASLGGLLPRSQASALAEYGTQLGMAYQIADDLHDMAAPGGVTRFTGKPRGFTNGAGCSSATSQARNIPLSLVDAPNACHAVARAASATAIRHLRTLPRSSFRTALRRLAVFAASHT